MAAPAVVQCGRLKLMPGERTYIMGIVNVTPDSFSDGGLYYAHEKAIDHALQLIDEGADILDIGGVSTAPKAVPVSLAEELERVLPVVLGLAKHGLSNISVDTSRAEVAQRALELGASWINDQHAALSDPEMPRVFAQAQACVVMHNRGNSGVEAGEHIAYRDVVRELSTFFAERLDYLAQFGVARDKVICDPGIGFGKGLADSLNLINNMASFGSGNMRLLGVSRKSFLGALTGIREPAERDFASLGAAAAGLMSGAHILRVHHVKATIEMTRVLDACLKQGTKRS